MGRASRTKPLYLSWEETGMLCEGLALTSRALRASTRRITEEYSLGPRGPWILTLLSVGNLFPMDLTKIFRVGRSLITAELTHLTEAGLVAYEKCANDGRRVELALTPLGEKVHRRVRQELSTMVVRGFSGYTRQEVTLCARMLQDFVAVESEEFLWRAKDGGTARIRPAAAAVSAKPSARKKKT